MEKLKNFVIKKIPYCSYTLKQSFEKRVDLLLLLSTKNSHYVLIKDFNKFTTNKTKQHGKKNFVDITYNTSLAQE